VPQLLTQVVVEVVVYLVRHQELVDLEAVDLDVLVVDLVELQHVSTLVVVEVVAEAHLAVLVVVMVVQE
jgi:hypothetical protein